MFKRRSKTVIDDALQLPLENGQPGLAFPAAIIDNLRYLITRIQRQQAKPGESGFPGCLALVSALPGEGVTYISYALAATLASDLGARVAIVDLNWHSQALEPFASQDAPGIAQVLDGQASLEEIIRSTGWTNLSILPAGACPPARRPALAHSPALSQLLAQAQAHFDILLLDLPAILKTSDAVAMASLADAVCLVVRQSRTRANSVAAALDEISHLTILGVILNQVQHATPGPILRLILGHS